MGSNLYAVADVFFFAFHTLVILFNAFGWMFRPLRIYNLALLSLTAFSWFVLGIWYGWGYCWCTDWHWAVRERLGHDDPTNSYIDLLLIKLTGLDFSDDLVNAATVIVFGASFAMSIFLNLRDYGKRRDG